ncbi:MAG: ATP-binding cassette domain-containing protein [Rhodospirillaceae bacterium]|nr:ATP-binding cassette domain-containing protein [Rhodospirillaceae bacterium]
MDNSLAKDQTNGSGANNTAVSLGGVHLRLNSDAGEVNILRGIDLKIGAGETVGLVGPSGSGKTSMLMIVAGLEKPSDGNVEIAGTDITHMSEDALALFRRKHTGIVFQNFHLVPTMNALENVALPLEFAGTPDAFERAAIQLDAVGLSKRKTHYPGQLSGGEQQRVALARAFVTEPTILLADEPTGNLDGKTGEQVMEILFDLHSRLGTTLLLITHAPQLADRCARILTMADGLVVDDKYNK